MSIRTLTLATLAVAALASPAYAHGHRADVEPTWFNCVTGKADVLDGCAEPTPERYTDSTTGPQYVRIVWWDAAGNKHENTTPGAGAVDVHYWLSPTLVQDVNHGGSPTTYTVDRPFVGDWHPVH